jgi:hypothetical protein
LGGGYQNCVGKRSAHRIEAAFETIDHLDFHAVKLQPGRFG